MTFATSIFRKLRGAALVATTVVLGACATEPELIGGVPVDEIVEGYGVLDAGEHILPPVPPQFLEGVNRRTPVVYNGPEGAGTIVVDPHAKLLYFVEENGAAMRYPIAVGRQGMRMRAPSIVQLKREWPGWTPTQNMLRTQPEVYGPFAAGVEGGPASPLGARALYLFQNGRDTFFRIHGTNDLPSIGNAGSAGCIRLFNHDIVDLYERVDIGTRVVIRTKAQSIELEGEELANRGVVLEPTIVDPETIYGATDVDPIGESELEEFLAENAPEPAEDELAEEEPAAEES